MYNIDINYKYNIKNYRIKNMKNDIIKYIRNKY